MSQQPAEQQPQQMTSIEAANNTPSKGAVAPSGPLAMFTGETPKAADKGNASNGR